MGKEIWKDVVGYEGYYVVSNFGRIGSCKKWTGVKYITRNEPLIRDPYINDCGYLSFSLSLNSKSRTARLHRLVALAFLPNPSNLPEVNHIDGDKLNARVDNLEWVSRLENIRHAFATGLIIPAKGEEQSNTKLTNEQVSEIYNSTLSPVILAKNHSVHHSTINDIRGGFTWKHITGGVSRAKEQKRYSDETILSIYNNGTHTAKEIAKTHKCSTSFVNLVRLGIKHTSITGGSYKRKIISIKRLTEEEVVDYFNRTDSTKDLAELAGISISYAKKIRHKMKFLNSERQAV